MGKVRIYDTPAGPGIGPSSLDHDGDRFLVSGVGNMPFRAESVRVAWIQVGDIVEKPDGDRFLVVDFAWGASKDIRVGLMRMGDIPIWASLREVIRWQLLETE